MKRIKKNNIIFLIIIVIIFIIVAEIFKQKNLSEDSPNSLSQGETISVLSNETIYVNDENIFAFNDNSVKLVNSNSVIWEDTISFNNPYSVFNNGILGISQKNSNVLKIYSKSGLLYTINSDSNIISFSLNENGYSSIITKKDDYYEITVYNSQGNLIFGLKNISYTKGIPISTSISSNNKLLAVSFLQIDDIEYNSNISLYNLDATTEDETENNLFAAFLQENQFSGIIEFTDNSHLLVISEKQVTFLKIINNNFSDAFYEIKLNNKLKFAKIIDSKNFVLVYGEPTSIENAFENNTVVFYNINGQKIGQYTSEKDITNISVGYNSCIIQCNRTLEAINNKGKLLWQYQVIQDLNQFYFFKNTNEIIVSSNNGVKIISINKKSNLEVENLEENANYDELIEEDELVEENFGNNNLLEDNINESEDLIDEIPQENDVLEYDNTVNEEDDISEGNTINEEDDISENNTINEEDTTEKTYQTQEDLTSVDE